MSAAAPASDVAPMVSVETNQGWWSQPAKNVLMIYLKEDVPTDTVLSHCERILMDHGVPSKRENASLVVDPAQDVRFGVQLKITTGRHPVAGNMVAIEMKSKSRTGEFILIGLAGVLVTVAVVALVAVIAVAAGGGGSGHGGHSSGLDCAPIIWPSGGGGSGVARRKRKLRRVQRRADAAMFYSSAVMYRAIIDTQTSNTHPTAESRVLNILDVEDKNFKKADDFFQYIFGNFKAYFYNTGFVRVPAEVISSLNAEPLDHRPQEGIVRPFQTKTFTVVVPEESCAGLSDTLRAELLADSDLELLMRHGRQPARQALFSKSTLIARQLGNHMLGCSAGPGQSHSLKPGVWYISIRNGHLFPVKYRVSAKLFEDVDKSSLNPLLFGCNVESVTIAEDSGEWEVISQVSENDTIHSQVQATLEQVEATGQNCARHDAPEIVPFGDTHGHRKVLVQRENGEWDYDYLTQAVDLRLLSDTQLNHELTLRGLPIPCGSNAETRILREATLFPLLPPVTSYQPSEELATGMQIHTSHDHSVCDAEPSTHTNSSGTDKPTDPQSVSLGDSLELDVDNVPYEFCCPITQEMLIDPVLAGDGFTYERDAIKRWLLLHNTSPMTGSDLPHKNLVPNLRLKSIIEVWSIEQQ